MSTISRRDFMKTAGVMTLAVAASAALAGCSTDNNSSEEVKPISTTSVAIGDYTVSVKAVKAYHLFNYQNGDQDGSKKLKDEAIKVAIVANVKYTGTTGWLNVPTEPTFMLSVIDKNLISSTYDDTKKYEKDLSIKNLELVNQIVGKYATVSVYPKDVADASADGINYLWSYNVEQYNDKKFKTPAAALNVRDMDGNTLTALTVSIPDAVDMTREDWGKLG